MLNKLENRAKGARIGGHMVWSLESSAELVRTSRDHRRQIYGLAFYPLTFFAGQATSFCANTQSLALHSEAR